MKKKKTWAEGGEFDEDDYVDKREKIYMEHKEKEKTAEEVAQEIRVKAESESKSVKTRRANLEKRWETLSEIMGDIKVPSGFRDNTGDMHSKYIIFDQDSETLISPIFYGVPPKPGKRAREERKHKSYNYTDSLFEDHHDDTKRQGGDWQFTTWTVRPSTVRVSGTTPTRIHTSKSGKATRVPTVEPGTAKMPGTQGGKDWKPRFNLEDAIFQCFDCAHYTKGKSRGLDAFCRKCNLLGKQRKDPYFASTMEPSKSKKSLAQSISQDVFIDPEHPQFKPKMKNSKYVYNFIDRYFVKERSSDFPELLEYNDHWQDWW